MNLTIFTAVFMVLVSFNQALGALIHNIPSKKGIIPAEDALATPGAVTEAKQDLEMYCPVCNRLWTDVECPIGHGAQ
ncbi:uncharacterized protein MELLADRAFT_124518 [Melampsora larici-populina 98AG31]|uniref:Secreted protein n=1 Tax=Melampsora larici-populina (strain 98AG31 / pathotype 3-4-7) TaxID=747676 RepID=F4RU91_MELLP|nr:uncharacterized protein MELLADRAFT_124518 [Melampsora larici-populina 98AG31]EGG04041.1 secreted protein [Melampsora larici-populina 98AG31]